MAVLKLYIDEIVGVKMKKHITFMKYLAACTAFVICLFIAALQTKAEVTENDITVDYDHTCLIVNARDNKEILFGVSKINKSHEITTSNWDVYEVSAQSRTVEIDLSFLKRTKDAYMQIKGIDGKEPITLYTMGIRNMKFKVDPVMKELYAVPISLEDLEYRTVYSRWMELPPSSDDAVRFYVPDMYWPRGARLYVRAAAIKGTDLLQSSGIKDQAGKEIPVLSIGRFPGKEVKVNIPKLKNAPKIAVNWEKRTITIPAKSEYRIRLSDEEQYGHWTNVGDKKLVLNEIALADFIKKGGTLEARLKATSKNAASKVSLLNTVGNNGKNLEAVFIPDDMRSEDQDFYWTNTFSNVWKWEGMGVSDPNELMELNEEITLGNSVRLGIPVTTEKEVPVIYGGINMGNIDYFFNYRSDSGGFSVVFENLSDVDSYQVAIETFGCNEDWDDVSTGGVDEDKYDARVKKLKTKTYTIKPKTKKKITLSLSFRGLAYRLKRMRIRLIGTDKNQKWPTDWFTIGGVHNVY